MKRVSLLVLMLLIAAFPAAAQQKKAQPVKEYTIEQFMNTVRIGGSSFSSDEKSILFHNNKTGIYNVYSVPVSGGTAAQLTNSTKESTYAVSYFPKDTRFLYRYDRGGNENERANRFHRGKRKKVWATGYSLLVPRQTIRGGEYAELSAISVMLVE